MLIDILWILAGLAMILFGANWLTDGSSSVARRFGLSDLVIGLTVVSFGTSMPELVISVMSALNGNAPLAVGNVVGSNIFNILAIIGVTALVRPVKVENSTLVNEIPLVVLSSVVLLVMCNGRITDGAAADMITRGNGIVLLMFFVVFMWYMLRKAHADKQAELSGGVAAPEPSAVVATDMPQWKAVLMVLAGLALLIGGGDRFVAGASGLASRMGVSDAVIGLTVAAAGTSLPELAASVAAALKGKAGMAVGNVIGSNLFNAFFILGTSASITPLSISGIGNIDLLTLLVASVLFWVFGWFFAERKITRAEGGVLTALYLAYTAMLVANA